MSNAAVHEPEVAEDIQSNLEVTSDDPGPLHDHCVGASGPAEYDKSLTPSLQQMSVWWIIENCQLMWRPKCTQLRIAAFVSAPELLRFLEWTGAALWSDRPDTSNAISVVHQFCSMFSKVVEGLSDGRLPVQASSREDLRANFNVDEFVIISRQIDRTDPKCMEHKLEKLLNFPETSYDDTPEVEYMKQALPAAQRAVEVIAEVINDNIRVETVLLGLQRLREDLKDLKVILDVFEYRKPAAKVLRRR